MGANYKNLISGTAVDGRFQPEGWPCWAEPRLRRGSAQHGHPKGWKRPSTTDPPIVFFFLHNATEKLDRIYVVCLGKNTRVRPEFLSQAKTTDFLIWCARNRNLSNLWVYLDIFIPAYVPWKVEKWSMPGYRRHARCYATSQIVQCLRYTWMQKACALLCNITKFSVLEIHLKQKSFL